MSVDLKAIEKRLNSDPDYQRRFLSDPVGVLQTEGLELTDTMADNLRNFVKGFTGNQAAVAGSNLTPEGGSIGISIGKSF